MHPKPTRTPNDPLKLAVMELYDEIAVRENDGEKVLPLLAKAFMRIDHIGPAEAKHAARLALETLRDYNTIKLARDYYDSGVDVRPWMDMVRAREGSAA